jgi:hypothetical protein
LQEGQAKLSKSFLPVILPFSIKAFNNYRTLAPPNYAIVLLKRFAIIEPAVWAKSLVPFSGREVKDG